MKRLLILIALLVFLTTAGLAQPYDIVSQRDWSYDFLAHLAAKGALPGHAASEFTGERLYTRAEIADFAAIAPDSPKLSPADLDLWRLLRTEYRRELASRGLAPIEVPKGADPLVLTGFLRGRFTMGADSGSTADKVYRASVLAPIGAGGLLGIGATDQAKEFSAKPDKFPALDRLFLRFAGRDGELEIGRDVQRWGPGDSGGMLLSDTSPNFTLFNAMTLSQSFNLGPLGKFKVIQFMTTYSQDSQRHYVMTRRFEKMVSANFGFSLMEAFNATKLPQAHLLVLPWYWYQHKVPSSDSGFNYLAGIDAWVRPNPRTEIYGDLVLDDVNAPTPVGGGTGVEAAPRKIGFLGGGRLKDLFRNGKTDLRVEYAFTDATATGGTYWHHNPEVAWYHDGLPIGHPIGAGGKGLFARVDHRISPRLLLIGAVSSVRHLETDPPQMRPISPVPEETTTAADFFVSYDLGCARAVSLRVAPFRITNAGNIAGQSEKGTLTELAATIAF